VTISQLEETLLLLIRSEGLPIPEREVTFAKSIGRRWRFDFCYPNLKIGIECEGGIYSGGRHVRGRGFENDCVKYDYAAIMGWTVLRFTKKMIESGQAVEMIKKCLQR
jgi:very-short-patch-repair endonuclease